MVLRHNIKSAYRQVLKISIKGGVGKKVGCLHNTKELDHIYSGLW